ncbi:hypothetical protein, partial [Escherichia coli]
MAVVGRDCTIGNRAVFEDLSALPPGRRIPPGERWSGSPAAATATGLVPRADGEAGALRRNVVAFGLAIAALLLPLVAIMPIAPGLIT